MKRLGFRTLLLTAVASISGIVVLLGYFLPILQPVQAVVLHWAIILGGWALLVGVINLVFVHSRRMSGQQSGSLYSLVVIVAFILTFFTLLIFGPNSTAGLWVFNYVQVPIEASLMAILAVTLVYAAARLLTRRPKLSSFILLAVALIVFIGTATPLADMFGLRNFVSTILVQTFAVGGARGILLGVALGAVATGLRILMGSDRPYGGS